MNQKLSQIKMLFKNIINFKCNPTYFSLISGFESVAISWKQKIQIFKYIVPNQKCKILKKLRMKKYTTIYTTLKYFMMLTIF